MARVTESLGVDGGLLATTRDKWVLLPVVYSLGWEGEGGGTGMGRRGLKRRFVGVGGAGCWMGVGVDVG